MFFSISLVTFHAPSISRYTASNFRMRTTKCHADEVRYQNHRPTAQQVENRSPWRNIVLCQQPTTQSGRDGNCANGDDSCEVLLLLF